MSRRTRLIIVATLCVAVVVLLLFFVGRFRTSEQAKANAAQRQRISRFDDPTLEITELAKNSDVPYSRVLADFREWAQYPQDSRPLNPEDIDQLRFEKIELPLTPMPIIENEKPKEPEHACVLQAESHTAYEDTQHETQLRCQNLKTGKFVLPDVKGVKLTRTAGTGTFNSPPPDIVKNDSGAMASVSFFFRPRSQDWGDMELTVDFSLPERGLMPHQLKTHFFSSPQAPAKFTGKFRDRLDTGSLVIAVEIQVRLPGSYRIEGNLMSDDGQPLAHARADARLAGGSTWVDLQFFGKIIRDKRIPGPYKLTSVRGQQMNLPINPDDLTLPPEQVARILAATEQTEPPKRAMLPWLGEFKTERYAVSQFSDAEYDSEFKRERLAELERLAAGQ